MTKYVEAELLLYYIVAMSNCEMDVLSSLSSYFPEYPEYILKITMQQDCPTLSNIYVSNSSNSLFSKKSLYSMAHPIVHQKTSIYPYFRVYQ